MGLVGMSLKPGAFSGLAADDAVEVWDSVKEHPVRVNGFVNQALLECINAVYDHVDPIYFPGVSRNRRLTLPDAWAMVGQIYRRRSLDFHNIYLTEDWEPTPDSIEWEQDYNDYRSVPSTRFDLTGVSTMGREISERNLGGMTHLEGWFKTTADITITIGLYTDDAVVSTNLVVLKAADGWSYIHQALATPEATRKVDEVIISVPVAEDMSLWLDGLWAVNEDSFNWYPLPRECWDIDPETDELVIHLPSEGMYQMGVHGQGYGYATYTQEPFSDFIGLPQQVLRILGGADPGNLADDDDVTEALPRFLIARATQLAFSSASGGRETDPNRRREQAQFWAREAVLGRRAFQPLANVRRRR